MENHLKAVYRYGLREMIGFMMQRLKNGWHTWLNTSVQLITIGSLVFWGGSLWSSVQSHEKRLEYIENMGSTPYQRHEDMDNERLNALRLRVTNVEMLVSVVSDLRGDLRVIAAKLDKLQDELATHERNTVRRQQMQAPKTQP